MRLASSLLLTLFFPGAAALAETIPIGPDLEAQGWRELAVPGRSPVLFTGTESGELHLRADTAVSFLYVRIAPTERAPRRLSWRWRVDRDIAPTNLALKGRDDRPLSVHVWFPAPAGLSGDPFRRAIIAKIVGAPEYGRALSYVWGGDVPAGTRIANPYMERNEGMLIVRRPAGTPAGRWHSETVDLAADYRAAFGDAPQAPLFIAISADTDDTAQSAAGAVADIRLE